MIAYLVRRIALAMATVALAVVLVFFAVRLLPGNPILVRFGQHAVPEKIEAEMKEQGWDRPLLVQLGDYLKRLVTRGDLGVSMLHPTERVSEALASRFPATIELAIAALLVAVPLGIAAGVAAAVWRNRFPDYLCMSGSLLGVSIPVFFLGICMMAFAQLFFDGEWTTGRRLDIGIRIETRTGLHLIDSLLAGRLDLFAMALKHLLLPALALGSIPTAIIARITRSSMIEVLSADYVRTARAKGGSLWRVVMQHALPNASIPIANIAGLQASMLLSGAVLTETVFSWPGVGSYLVASVLGNDYSVVQGSLLLVATIFVAFNLGLDVLYAWLDPRVRQSKSL